MTGTQLLMFDLRREARPIVCDECGDEDGPWLAAATADGGRGRLLCETCHYSEIAGPDGY